MTDWQAIASEAVRTQQAAQDPHELAVLLALLESEGTSSAVEIGTFAGGLTWALARLPAMKQIITVDTHLQPGAVDRLAALPVRTSYIRGDSALIRVQAEVDDALDRPFTGLLVIDGDHAYKQAAADWENYRFRVATGGVAVIHDTQGFPGRPDVEVPRLWAEIRDVWETTEIVSRPGGPYGTGIVWL